MLESPALLIRPPDAAAARAVVEPADGVRLGAVRRRRVARWPAFWLCPTLLEVREAEDEPLVFTVRRGWLWPGGRVVLDADGRHVGSLNGPWLCDRGGRGLGVVVRNGAVGDRVIRGVDGRFWAAVHDGPSGTRIDFAADLEGEPFVRMLVLAAALAE
jgi:hypothetical protein